MHKIRKPPDSGGHDFRLPQIAKFIGVPLRTADGWLASARAQGFDPGVSEGRFRWLSAYHIYGLALLAELANVGFPITPHTIWSAFDFARVAPSAGTHWIASNSEASRVTVDAAQCFAVAQHWAERQRAKAA